MSKSVKVALIANGIITTAKGLTTLERLSFNDGRSKIHSTVDCGYLNKKLHRYGKCFKFTF